MSLNREPKPKVSKKGKMDLSAVASGLNFETESVRQEMQDLQEIPIQQDELNTEKKSGQHSNKRQKNPTKVNPADHNEVTDTSTSEGGYHRDADGRLRGKSGKPIGRPRKGTAKKSVQKHITCTEEQAERYMKAAEKDGRLFPQFATMAIEEYIKNHNLED